MEEQLCRKFLDFIRIVARLREPGGCPWDQKQTPQSFKTYLIEEVYELVDAIDQDNPQEILGELGDMLFQLLFINNLYEEKGHFNFVDVIEAISAKMIRRHPHVFGDKKIKNLQDLKDQWYSIKAEERHAEGRRGHQLKSLPKGLPALRRAHRVQERASKLGFSPETSEELLGHMDDCLTELKKAVVTNDQATAIAFTGKLLMLVANLARLQGFSTEDALQKTINIFIDQFGAFEDLLDRRGLDLNTLDQSRQRELWQQAKSD
jgi:MazG family protein